MAKAILVIGLELKSYIGDWPSEANPALDKWANQLKSLNDAIISRIRTRLGDGTAIQANQYESELAEPATRGWKAFVGYPNNNNPMAVIGALKHELRVKGGVYKYIQNVENAFTINPQTNKSYFQERVDSAYSTGRTKRIFAALQVVGARFLEKTLVPAAVMAMTGDGRYAYLLEQGKVSGYAAVATKVVSANNTLSDWLGLTPAFEPHSAPYIRPYLMGAIVQRFHLAVAAANVRETGIIDDTQFVNYLKEINRPFYDLSSKKAGDKNDVAIGFVDPLDATLKPSDAWNDRRNKAALAFCIATGTDTCTEVRNYYPS